MAIEDFVLKPLRVDTEIKPFKCMDKDLNGFLMDDAKKYLIDLMAVTYLLEDPLHDRTVAYYSLLNDKISYDPLNRSVWNRLNRLISNPKRRRHYPAVKIGRLAVSEDYRHTGTGKYIIGMVKHIYTHESMAGCRFITVDAYPEAVEFYRRCGFECLSERGQIRSTVPMFYDLKRFLDETITK